MSLDYRPRRFPELVDVAFALCREHLGALAVLAAVSALPVIAAQAAMATVMPTAAELETLGESAVELSGRMLLLAPLTLAAWLWFFVASASLVVATATAYRGEPIDAGAALRRGLARGWSVLGANVLKGLALVAGMMAAALAAGLVSVVVSLIGGGIVGGIASVLAVLGAAAGIVYLVLRWYLVTVVATLEGKGPSDALSRSLALTKGAAGRVAMVHLVTGAIAIAIALVGLLGSTMLASATGLTALAGLANSLWVLVYPLGSVFATVLYFDQRIRLEGYDLELMAERLGAAGDSDAPSLPATPAARDVAGRPS